MLTLGMMMQTHPGRGERRAFGTKEEWEAQGQPGLFVFEGDSLTCHHNVLMVICDGVRVKKCVKLFDFYVWELKY